MPRGRKPKPPALKVLSGTNQPCREIQDVPDYDLVDDFPDAPLSLRPDGVEMWNDLGPKLVSASVLQIVDLYPLEHLCFLWQQFRQKAKAGVEPTAAEHTALMRAFSEFGMTPASRQRVTAGGDKGKGNKFKGNGKRT